jgi:hypothetical protein
MYDIPKSLETRLIAVGGLNRFGEPNYRVVWGGTRLTWIGGEWRDEGRRIIEERQVEKYLPAERFYLEKWMPPEHYGSPEKWAEYCVETVDGIRIPSLGPYPSRGEYELSMRFQTASGDFAPIEGAEGAIVELIQMIKQGECTSKTENWLAIKRQQEKKDQDWNRYADAVLDDTNEFDGKIHLYQGTNPTVKRTRKTISPRELKAVRYIDMGAKVGKPPEATA